MSDWLCGSVRNKEEMGMYGGGDEGKVFVKKSDICRRGKENVLQDKIEKECETNFASLDVIISRGC